MASFFSFDVFKVYNFGLLLLIQLVSTVLILAKFSGLSYSAKMALNNFKRFKNKFKTSPQRFVCDTTNMFFSLNVLGQQTQIF